MWHKLQELSQLPLMKCLSKLIGDPVQLYAVFLVTTVMYYYHSGMTWLYTVLAIFASWLMMRFYDFIAGHKWIGPLTYLLYLFGGLEIVGMLTNWGQQGYPISFMVWFLTPQSVVSFSVWYTISIYLLMLGFLTSAVYYFSKIRYRMSMQFLIMLIPLSLYAKEGLQMPAVLVMILLAGFFLLMIYCRQFSNKQEIRHLSTFHGNLSVVVYVLAFSIMAAIIPKPTIMADREFIENAMSYSSWSDILMNAISMFTDTTDNSVGTSNNTRTLYYVSSPESLRLRTQTYSYYTEDDSWNVISDYDYPDTDKSEAEQTYQPRELIQAILNAAELDTDFAEKYALSAFAGTVLPEQELQHIELFTLYPMQVLPSPTRTSTAAANSVLTVSRTGTFRGANLSNWSDIRYYSDNYARYQAVQPVLQKLSASDYGFLLQEAQGILQDIYPEQAELLEQVYTEYLEAYAYLSSVQEQDFQSEMISELAEQITDGLDSDFDKAKAIEDYFLENGFVYDQSYQKARGENAEYFLTQSKTGVCYEYATAMVLLCRSIGLPSRYTQGYNLSELYSRNIQNRETNYVIKVRDAHAFPEVYISGYGWISFEPTVPSMDLPENYAENQNVAKWGFILLCTAIIAGLFYLYLPHIRERLFQKRLFRLSSDTCATAAFRRMRCHLHLSDSITVQELAEQSRLFYTEQDFFAMLDLLLYAEKTEDIDNQSVHIASSYQNWYKNLIQFRKEQAKKAKTKS